MTTKQVRTFIRNTLKYGKASEAKRVRIMEALEEIKEEDPYFYYMNAGRVSTVYGRYDEAIELLENAIKLNPESAPSYFNLYKCYAAKGDYIKSFVNLCDCDKTNMNDANFELPHAMLSTLIDMDIDFIEFKNTEYKVPNTNKVYFAEIDGLLSQMYNEVIIAFNEKRYHDALKKLGDMKGHILKIRYPLDIDSLIVIMREIVKKESDKNSELISIKRDSFESDDHYLNYFNGLVGSGYVSVNNILLEVEKMIKLGNVELASNILNTLPNMEIFAAYSIELDYLNNLLNEKIAYLGLGDERKQLFIDLKTQGSKLYHAKRYKDAFKLYEKAYEITGLNIFEYYLGKCLFRMKRLEYAEEYFLRYLEHGGEKKEKTLLFLIGIGKIRNDEYGNYLEEMNRINLSFNRSFKYQNKEENGKYSDNSENSRKSTFTVSDFNDDSTVKLDIENYYNYGVDGKLKIIRELYRTGKVDAANLLLDELKKTCPSKDKEKVLQMVRNKKLYEAQAKFS